VPYEIAATEGYGISMQKRKLIEQGFGWAKFIGPIRPVMVCGIKKVDQVFVMAMSATILDRLMHRCAALGHHFRPGIIALSCLEQFRWP
jgi:hypothetical protein